MAKLACTCGHVIVDQAGSLPWKAHLYADQDADTLFDDTAGLIAECAAMAPDERREWLAAHFGPGYPAGQPLDAVVTDLMASTILPLTRHAYECERCGTVWIQRARDGERFQPYTPAPGGERGIFRSVRHAVDAADGATTS